MRLLGLNSELGDVLSGSDDYLGWHSAGCLAVLST